MTGQIKSSVWAWALVRKKICYPKFIQINWYELFFISVLSQAWIYTVAVAVHSRMALWFILSSDIEQKLGIKV